MAAPEYLLTADAIVPMEPGLPTVLRGDRDGGGEQKRGEGVIIKDGRVAAIGELADLRRQFGQLPPERQHLRGVLLPGLINAHTHLELSYLAAADLRAGHFAQWVEGMMARRPTGTPEEIAAVIRAAARKGAEASLAAGVTCVGDITRHPDITRPELAATPLRAISFGEIMALGKLRHRLEEGLRAAANWAGAKEVAQARNRILPGLSPHAPYTVEGPALRAIVRRAILGRFPVTMHLAELAEETAFLRDFSGPLGRDWNVMKNLDILDDAVPTYTGGPIRWAQLHGLLLTAHRNRSETATHREFPIILAHVNYCDNAELAQLAAATSDGNPGSAGVSIAYCPRTHAYFAHPPHRYRDMLDGGINVCLGTDSLASNPDLSLLKEAQFLHTRDHLPAITALDMITRRGALALGLATEIGTLAPGKWADMAHFPLTTENLSDADLLAHLLTQSPAASTVWIAGEQVLSTNA